jgi:hypothetical protein
MTDSSTAADAAETDLLADAHAIEGDLPGDELGRGLGNGNPSDPP